MQILSHRGYWRAKVEQNTLLAFEQALEINAGIETDIRDFQGRLAISHDMASEKSLMLEKLFELHKASKKGTMLALNIKADGLACALKLQLGHFQIKDYFVFDMSVPDTIYYLNEGLNVFTRQSEYEPRPAFYGRAKGVWLDSFKDEKWITREVIIKHMNNDKKVAIVSPELHSREHKAFWQHLKDMKLQDLLICTDFPLQAKGFFHAKD